MVYFVFWELLQHSTGFLNYLIWTLSELDRKLTHNNLRCDTGDSFAQNDNLVLWQIDLSISLESYAYSRKFNGLSGGLLLQIPNGLEKVLIRKLLRLFSSE